MNRDRRARWHPARILGRHQFAFPSLATAWFALLLAALVTGCGDGGDPVQPSLSLTGRWEVSLEGSHDAVLELVEEDGALAGRYIVVDGDATLGEYAIRNGTASNGAFSFSLDPLDPPVAGILESLGNVAIVRINGTLVNRETLFLEYSQTCATESCLVTETAQTLAAPIFTASASIDRPFIRSGIIGDLSLAQTGPSLSGSLRIIYGSTQGGTLGPSLPIRSGGVSDTSSIFFVVDPADDPTGALAETLGCAAPINYAGRIDQGSQVRFFVWQVRAVEPQIEFCFSGSVTWAARPVLDNFAAVLPAVIDGEGYEVKLATEQSGSVIDGTLTIENDARRIGPLPIDIGRFAAGRATLEFPFPPETPVSFLRALGGASPIVVTIRIEGGDTARVSVREECPCLSTLVLARRLRVGV